MDLISFIEDILIKEPDRNMLRFALLLLYLQIGDIKISKGLLKEYLENKESSYIDENTINQLKQLYGKDVIEKLIEANK